MNARYLMAVFCGAVGALVVVVACGDDSPTMADAAVDASCNCPAAEPPLLNRIVRVEAAGTISAIGTGGASVGCPEGAIALGGSCSLVEQNDIEQVRLIEAGHPEEDTPTDWSCRWFNGSNVQINAVAAVNCYLPPAQ
jgi:hypothetical protein